MPKQSSGDPRYRARERTALRQPAMVVDGIDLGPALKPAEIMLRIRGLLQLTDAEVAEAMHDAADCEDLAERWPELTGEEIDILRERAAEVTNSRAVVWRRRAREMDWLELRALLTGLTLS